MRSWILLAILAECGDELAAGADGSIADAAADGATAVGEPPALTLVKSWGGHGTATGLFVEPSSVEIDSAGYVYVAGHEDRVQQFTRDAARADLGDERNRGTTRQAIDGIAERAEKLGARSPAAATSR